MDSQVSERLKIDRIHVAPRALELSAGAQKRFMHMWAPLDDLVAKLRALPTGLIRFWLDQPGGHVVITHQSSRYEPGEQSLKRHVLRNVAYVEAAALAQDSLEALVPIGHLLDHLLGSSGAAEGLWLSEGGGANPALREVGARIIELFPLGYGFDEAACLDVHAYFARSLALCLQDRRALNIADPLMEKLLRTALLSQSFWRSPKMSAPGA